MSEKTKQLKTKVEIVKNNELLTDEEKKIQVKSLLYEYFGLFLL